jgi:CRISPR/Cas system-associated exonuclease Cas4 (RecB family)
MLPNGFTFSQVSLQDFVDCRRRFELRYLMRVQWPAAESEPIEEQERRMQRGADFHRLVHQQLMGISEDKLTASISDPTLAQWWEHYLSFRPVEQADISQGYEVYPEATLMTALRGYRLMAKYDVIVSLEDGKFFIFDWKTSRRRYESERAEKRLQTRVYRTVLVRSGARFVKDDVVSPGSVTMVYWFATHPTAPIRLPYSELAYERDLDYLQDLVAQIEDAMETDAGRSTQDEVFPKTENRFLCRYCPYRSYCGRGSEAGDIDEHDLVLELDAPEPESTFDFDFDQIAEIEF